MANRSSLILLNTVGVLVPVDDQGNRGSYATSHAGRVELLDCRLFVEPGEPLGPRPAKSVRDRHGGLIE
jgi:hypothetical protein